MLRRGQQALAASGSASPRLDAEVLLMWLLGIDRATLYLAHHDTVPEAVARQFAAAIARAAAGEPIAYITGHRAFFGLEFQVDPRVLIPRPETEHLVEWALAWLSIRPAPALVVDVGTGSGAIAVSLAHHARGQHRVVGSDLSAGALAVARENARRLAPGRVHLVRGDLLSWCAAPIDLILANLPYLRPDQAHPGIAHEPDIALYVAGDGFELYQHLLAQASRLLRPDGAIGCEIDPSQQQRALDEARRAFPGAPVRVEPDLAGLQRYLFVELPAT